MGVEDYLLASSLLGVLAQRLVRVLCLACKRAAPAGPELAGEHAVPGAEGVQSVYEEVGCRECAGTGYRGRSGIYELLPVNEDLRKMILARKPADQIKATAVELGMRTLRDDGWRKVAEGVTTGGEVLRVTQDE
jgi:general secretion pathway protein E